MGPGWVFREMKADGVVADVLLQKRRRTPSLDRARLAS